VHLNSIGTDFGREWLTERLRREPVIKTTSALPRYVLPADRMPVPAAVLVPVVNHPTGPTLMFTQRTAHLHDHAGQISFPGGRVEEADADREATALRETEEETGLHRSRIEILGRLPEYDIRTGFRVTPVVGWVEPPYELEPDSFEVEQVFEVPLAFFLNPENHQEHSWEVDGTVSHYYAMPYLEHHIWGATAGMVHSLYLALVGQT